MKYIKFLILCTSLALCAVFNALCMEAEPRNEAESGCNVVIPIFVNNITNYNLEFTYLINNMERIKKIVPPNSIAYLGTANQIRHPIVFKRYGKFSGLLARSYDINLQKEIAIFCERLKISSSSIALKALITDEVKRSLHRDRNIDVEKTIKKRMEEFKDKKSLIMVNITSGVDKFITQNIPSQSYKMLSGLLPISFQRLPKNFNEILPSSLSEKIKILFPDVTARAGKIFNIIDEQSFEGSNIPFTLSAYILGLPSDVKQITKKNVDIAAQNLIEMWSRISENHSDSTFAQFRSNIDEIIDIVRKSRQVVIDKINATQKPVATEEFVLLDN